MFLDTLMLNFYTPMINIKEFDIVVAFREMDVLLDGERTETFSVKVGMPYEYGEGFDWCCPYEIGTDSNKKLRGIFGIDSIQALELAMQVIKVETEYWEKFRVG